MDEEWRQVKGYERYYEVSNLGRVKSLPRLLLKGRILKNRLNKYGYEYVTFCCNTVRKNFYVHHLVAKEFIGEAQGEIGTRKGQYTINHKDFNKANNTVENLDWVTAEDNLKHARENLPAWSPKGEINGRAVMSNTQVRRVKSLLLTGNTNVDIAKKFGVGKSTISNIRNRWSWKIDGESFPPDPKRLSSNKEF